MPSDQLFLIAFEMNNQIRPVPVGSGAAHVAAFAPHLSPPVSGWKLDDDRHPCARLMRPKSLALIICSRSVSGSGEMQEASYLPAERISAASDLKH